MICPSLSSPGQPAIAQALRAVDCMAAETTQVAFGRLFGGEGAMTAALTIGLTIYVALFAVGLLTGRASLNLSAVTPRMMGLGLALTFATSWVAYSSVIWNLLSAGPDWIAAVLLDVKGSASHAFAARLDVLFAAVADAAEQARQAAGDKESMPADLLSYAALLLLLGTVGVLVTSRIALAALLAIGPVFLMLSLFTGTRGLFEGWVKAAVMFALVPLFTVLIGAASVGMLTPVIAGLAGGDVSLDQAASVFVAAAVHCALMVLVLRLVATMTSGWTMRQGTASSVSRHAPGPVPASPPAAATSPGNGSGGNGASASQYDDRVRTVVAASARSASQPNEDQGERTRIVRLPGATVTSLAPQVAASGGSATVRADSIGRALRRAPSAQSIPEISS
ncbi:MAG: type IV secretion system protein [Novosphingobium sp.]|nr:type IV secretion system protein [Novosphingobium sp.]